MTDPFTHDSDALLNIARGVVQPEDVAQTLVHSTEKGRQQMNAFVEKRIKGGQEHSFRNIYIEFTVPDTSIWSRYELKRAF